MKQTWDVQFNGSFFEVLPIADTKDHYLGDECWCDPRTERSVHTSPYLQNTPFQMPGQFAQPVIVHNSQDKREVIQISEPAQ